MPRVARNAPGGIIFHVMNRANGRLHLFKKPQDFLAFEQVLIEAHRRVPGCRVLDWCCMGNHWHLVLWPRRDGELTAFMRSRTRSAGSMPTARSAGATSTRVASRACRY